MSLNSFFASLLPKEDKFFPLFLSMSEHIVAAANVFSELISSTDYDKQVRLYQDIKSTETLCDQIMVDIFEELNNSFVAPFDREDMHELCDALDDVMDYINSSAKRAILYRPKAMPTAAMHMAEIILEGTKAIHVAFGELKVMNKRPETALDQCNKLHDLEHEGDDVYDGFLQEIFASEKDALELIKLKEIMQCMEKATDRANKVGKVLKTIIVKYA